MYAVFIEVDTGDADMEAALMNLQQNVIPRVREAGARAGYWLDSAGGSRRVSMMLFDSEDEARTQAATIPVGETPPGAPEGLTIRNVEVSEVVASF